MTEPKPGPKQSTNVFGFMDEVGSIHSTKVDRVFGLGLIKVPRSNQLHRSISSFRNKKNFHGEFKFKDVDDRNLSLYKQLIDIFFASDNLHFGCIFFDKDKLDFDKYFKNNYYKAYNAFASKLISDLLDVSEYIAIVADDISTPKSDNFEKEMYDKVRLRTRRSALFGVCRLESHCVNEIQITDVILGTVAYDFKIKYGVVKPKRNAKFALVKHLRNHLNSASLSEPREFSLKRGVKFSIKEFKGNVP
jgi:hypothetical protein